MTRHSSINGSGGAGPVCLRGLSLFDRYMLRNLAITAVIISLTLVILVFLSQSLRFLELVMESSASSFSFWLLTLLALPRFFEVIVPIGMLAATVFVYNRMTMDSEMVAIKSAGYSPLQLARPALLIAVITGLFLAAVTLWIAPRSAASMQTMRQAIKSQFSTLIFREGVFNKVGKDFTVYVRERGPEGELRGIMIYDSRDRSKQPSTILAKSGALVAEGQDYDVVVYDGSLQEYDSKTQKLQKLNFERYKVSLPDSAPARPRWRQADERTIFELLNPDLNNKRDAESLREFKVEIHRRLTAPFLPLVFTLVACAALLTGAHNRRGQIPRLVACVGGAIILQGFYMMSGSLARQTDWAFVLMYGVLVLPIILSVTALRYNGLRLGRLRYFSARTSVPRAGGEL
jgi:lipopolysaccharide export system permease protein